MAGRCFVSGSTATSRPLSERSLRWLATCGDRLEGESTCRRHLKPCPAVMDRCVMSLPHFGPLRNLRLTPGPRQSREGCGVTCDGGLRHACDINEGWGLGVLKRSTKWRSIPVDVIYSHHLCCRGHDPPHQPAPSSIEDHRPAQTPGRAPSDRSNSDGGRGARSFVAVGEWVSREGVGGRVRMP